MISASELNAIATEAKNRIEEENAKVELEKVDKLLRVKAENGWLSTSLDHLSQIAICRLRQLGYKVEYDDGQYFVSWDK